MDLSLVLFARTILDGLLYTIVKLIWKLIQSRIVPTLVLVDIFWFREQQAYQCKITQSTGMTTQMQLNVLFITWPPALLERKNNNKVVSFSALFFMFALTWITKKELERVIENKGDEFLGKKTWKFKAAVRK